MRPLLVGVLVGALVLLPVAPALAAPPVTPAPVTPAPVTPAPVSPATGAGPSGLAARTDRVGDAARRLDDLTARLDGQRTRLADRLELSQRTVADDTAATGAAQDADRAVGPARDRAARAAAASETARLRVDGWVAAQYQQADAAGISSLLAGSQGPADVLDRALLHDTVSTEQQAALDALAAARARADGDAAAATAAQQAAADAARRATAAREAARAELGRARDELGRSQRDLAALTAARDTAAVRLDTLAAADPAVAARRQAERAAATAATAASSASDAAARDAATARLAAPRARADRVATVVDRALSQLGVTYAWGGGDGDGPTRGVRDGGVADSFGDFDRTGFDCSGLMIYAFAGIGTTLPHYSGYQAEAGRRVPLAERRAGDMLFWADPADGVHHVALYLGGGRMVEAPESGKAVRITPLRTDGLLPQVTRLVV